MKYQSRTYTCGPAAVANALRVYGCKFTEAQIAIAAGTTRDGTDDKGLLRALRLFRCKPKVINRLTSVRKYVRAGTPVIIHLDEELHWVVVIGCIGKNLIAFDSDTARHNKLNNGIRVITPATLGPGVYGVTVNPPFNGRVH